MIYDYKCSDCGNIQEDECSINTFKEHKPACKVCWCLCDYIFTPTNVHFVLKDGPSGSWPSKGMRINNQRMEASNKAAARQKKRYKTPSLVPNFNGKETESWREAQTEALKELGPSVASTYENKVKSETQV
jgi:hypothetical protein